MADCSATNLVAQAKCFYPCILNGSADAVIIYLLCQIAANGTGGGGGGGTGGVTCGIVDPSGAPTNTCTIYFRTDTGKFWYWDAPNTQWVNFIT